MIDFDFISPTKIYFGKKKEELVGSIIKSYGFKNIALVYGKGSIKKSGLYDTVINSLKENDINYIEFEGVEANPKLSFVKKCLKQLKGKPIDMILAVGGGSVLDTSKSISHGYYYDGDPFDFNLKKVNATKVVPVGAILTISAAGSELSTSCVISNDEVTPFIKQGFNNDDNRPLFAICNPELTYSVNKYQTAAGIVDIMMHTLERIMNANDDSMLADEFAYGLLRTVLHYGKIAYEDPNNYEARAQLMLASSYSHNGLTSLGKTTGMRVHGLEHIVSGCYDAVTHGAGLAILWPAWCLYVLDDSKANYQLTKIAKALFDIDDPKVGIYKLKEYFKEIGMPTKWSDLGFEVDYEYMANAFSANKTKSITNFKLIDFDGFIKICKLAEE